MNKPTTKSQRLTFNQQSQVLDHLDKARLILQSATAGFEYHGLERRITAVFHDIQILKVAEDETK